MIFFSNYVEAAYPEVTLAQSQQLETLSIVPTGNLNAYTKAEDIRLDVPLLNDMRRRLFAYPLTYYGDSVVGGAYSRVAEVVKKITEIDVVFSDAAQPYYISNYIELAQLVQEFAEFVKLELEKANKLVPSSPNLSMESNDDQNSDMDTFKRRKRDLNSSSLNQTGITKGKSRVKRNQSARQELLKAILALNTRGLRPNELKVKAEVIDNKLQDLRIAGGNYGSHLMTVIRDFLIFGVEDDDDQVERQMDIITNFDPEDLEDFLYERVSLWNDYRHVITVPSAQKRGRVESDSDLDGNPHKVLKGSNERPMVVSPSGAPPPPDLKEDELTNVDLNDNSMLTNHDDNEEPDLNEVRKGAPEGTSAIDHFYQLGGQAASAIGHTLSDIANFSKKRGQQNNDPQQTDVAKNHGQKSRGENSGNNNNDHKNNPQGGNQGDNNNNGQGLNPGGDKFGGSGTSGTGDQSQVNVGNGIKFKSDSPQRNQLEESENKTPHQTVHNDGGSNGPPVIHNNNPSLTHPNGDSAVNGPQSGQSQSTSKGGANNGQQPPALGPISAPGQPHIPGIVQQGHATQHEHQSAPSTSGIPNPDVSHINPIPGNSNSPPGGSTSNFDPGQPGNNYLDNIVQGIVHKFVEGVSHTLSNTEEKLRGVRKPKTVVEEKPSAPTLTLDQKVNLEKTINGQLTMLLTKYDKTFHLIKVVKGRPRGSQETLDKLMDNMIFLVNIDKELPFKLPFNKVFIHALALSNTVLTLFQNIMDHKSFLHLLENRNFPDIGTDDYDVFMGAKNTLKLYKETLDVYKYTPVPLCLGLDPSYCVEVVLDSNIFEGFPPAKMCHNPIKSISKTGAIIYTCDDMWPPRQCVLNWHTLITNECETKYGIYKPINLCTGNIMYTCNAHKQCHYKQYNSDNSASRVIKEIHLTPEFLAHFESDYHAFQLQAAAFFKQHWSDMLILGASLATIGLFALAVYRLIKNRREPIVRNPSRPWRVNQVEEMIPLKEMYAPTRGQILERNPIFRSRSPIYREKSDRFTQFKNPRVNSPSRLSNHDQFLERRQQMRARHQHHQQAIKRLQQV